MVRNKKRKKSRVRHVVHQRKLAAIMFTDMVGYTTLSQRNESLSLALVSEQRRLLRPIFKRHSGREIDTVGDAFLVEFQSALDATRCAYDIQRTVREYSISVPEDERFALRVGVHVGDVIESDAGELSGDAVNVASRIEPLAEHGGVCITRQVYDHVQNKFELPLESIGRKSLKNVRAPIEVYKMVMPWEQEKRIASRIQFTKTGEETKKEAELDPLRIAVLPFSNISPDSSDEYFADGMTEELISTISKIGGLQVIARTSVMPYKAGNKRIAEIARELKVGTILEGSVRKVEQKLRITAQLIDSQDSRHLWSETYDREFKDIFEIQSDISRTVANALRIRLGANEVASITKQPTRNIEAYNMFLRGMYTTFQGFLKEDLLKAISFFEKAVKLDQSFATAYSWLAESYIWLADIGYLSLDERKATLSKAIVAVNKALQIDSELADAHLVLSSLKQAEFDWTSAEREIRKALELNANVPAGHEAYAWLLAFLGRVEEVAIQAKMGLELNPLDFGANRTLALVSYLTKDYDAAIEQEKKMNELYSGGFSVRIAADLGLLYLSKPDYRSAIEEFQRAIELDQGKQKYDESLTGLAFAYAKLGRTEEARKILDDLKETSKTRFVPYRSIAQIHLALGEKDEAIKFLERAYDEGDVLSLQNLRFLATYDELRSDLRFIALLKKIGLMSPEEALYAEREIQRTQAQTILDKKRIAILPFANISPDPNDEYFANGMTEELINAISHVQGLRVIARTSVSRYRGSAKAVSEIGKELSVGSVMEGSVRKAGDRVRVTAQLIDVESEEHLWSENFDRKLEDIFVIQSDIAEMVADALKSKLAEKEKKKLESGYTDNPKAYNKYLLAKYSRTPFQDHLTKIKYYEEAIELDPSFAEAYASLADYYVVLSGDFISPKDAFFKASEHIVRALELDEGLSSVWIAKGNLAYQYAWDAQKAEKYFKKAIELNPSESTVYARYTALCISTARYEEALQLALKERSLNPYPPYPSGLVGSCYAFLKRHDAAVRELDRLAELYPGEPNRHNWAGLIYGLLGMPKEAVGELDQLRARINELREQGVNGWTASVSPGFYALNILNYTALGEMNLVKSIMIQVEEAARSEHVDLSVLGTLHLAAGDKEKALDFFERAFNERDSAIFMYHTTLIQLLKNAPELYDSVHSDPRFTALFERIGIRES